MLFYLRRFMRSVWDRWRSGALTFPVVLTALLAAVAAVLAANLHPGHSWNGDFAQYLMHAQNIVRGQPYAEMPYVRNPVNNNPGPPAYPPGFPLLLAPIYAVFGPTILPMKILIIATFVTGLGLTAHLLRGELPDSYTLALVVVLGFNPYLVKFTASVVSDLPFVLFVVLSLFLWRRSRTESILSRKRGLAVLVGLCIYFTVLIRSLGIVLPASILIYELLDQRRLSKTALIGLGTVAVAIGIQTVVSVLSAGATASTGVSYYRDIVQQSLLNRISMLASTATHSLYAYAEFLGKILWEADPVPLPSLLGPTLKIIGGITVLLSVGGWIHHVLSRLSLFDVFTALYIAALLPWGFHVDRYLIPVLPFCVFYIIYSLYNVHRGLQSKHPVFLIFSAGLLLTVYAWRLGHYPGTESETGALAPAAEHTYRYLQKHTASDDLVVFGKPRFVALKTGRRSVRWFEGSSQDKILTYFMKADVAYVLVGPPGANRGDTIVTLVEDHPARFAPTYQNAHFTLYRFIPGGESSVSTSAVWQTARYGTRVTCTVPDSVSGTEPMRAIRPSRSREAPKCTVPRSRIVRSRQFPRAPRRKTYTTRSMLISLPSCSS